MFPEPLHVGRPNMGDREELNRLIDGIYDRKWLTNGGPLVIEFERRLAELLGVSHCITIANGTVALEIAIRALGLTGEVIVPSYTFIATAHALNWQGLTPVFADIDETTHNLDPDSVRAAITPRTSGIIGVHLWGRAAPVDELEVIAKENNLFLLFDAAHAFGNSYKGKMIGSLGSAEVFSFHATKFFNTFEGGAVTTNSDALAKKMRLMRNFGFRNFDEVIFPGTNGKMSEICAAMGLVNLNSIDSFINRNVKNYLAYGEIFSTSDLLNLLEYEDQDHKNHQYVVIELSSAMAKNRDRLVAELMAENIQARKYFWPGCHLMEPYKSLFPHSGMTLPNTSTVAARVIVLPTGEAVDTDTCHKIAQFIISKLESY